MAKINFTPAQKEAIEEKSGNILVSASAGSGKTRVLVERVLHHLRSGIGIDEMLIVTFTEAAAEEMRERIQSALQKEVSTAPVEKKQWYVTQLTKLNTANISTLHAFCLHLIQRYYYIIGLDPVFRLLSDDTERELLREDVWNEVREEFYGQKDELFEQLAQNFSNDRSDEGLTDVVFRTFDFAGAKADSASWLHQIPTIYQNENENLTESSLYKKKLVPILTERLKQAEAVFEAAAGIAKNYSLSKFEETLKKDQEMVEELLQKLQTESWNTLRNIFQNLTFQRAPQLRKLEDEQKKAKDELLGLRNAAKKVVNDLNDKYFLLDEKQIKDVLQESQKLVTELMRVVVSFSEAFTAEKRQRHLLDFNDLEHLALKILQGKTPESRQVQENLQQKFSEILVDEYQDTNQLQETLISRLVGTAGNLFMVGDVKQSIYGFRLADPALFLRKYHAYAQAESNGKRIILAENFRSVKDITAFSNLIFMQLMDKQVGGLDYDKNAQLKYGANYYPPMKTETEVLIYESETKEESKKEKEPFDESFTVDNAAEGQVLVAVQKIKRLLAENKKIYDRKLGEKRNVQFGDIVLLVPTRNNNLLIMSEFQKAGLPVYIKDAQNYFQTTEIQIMLSLLKIIDNPYQDIPLVSVLRSPIVGLKENALAYLRINKKTGDYYQAVKTFQKNFDPRKENDFGQRVYEKVGKFLRMLTSFRDLAHQNQLADLIWEIYDQTGFLDYVGGMPGGAQRQANLHALYERASEYEKMSFRGLFQFIRFVNKLQKRDQDLAEANSKVAQDAVQVMTIHGSKGLEFPIVFLMDATRQFNERALKEDYLLDDTQGLGITLLLPKERIKVDTLPKLIINEHKQRQNAAEQMRLLYVALTRAEQQLYIVGTYRTKKEAVSKWKQAFQAEGVTLGSSLRQETKCFMDWIGMCLIRRSETQAQFGLEQPKLAELEKNTAHFKISFFTQGELKPAQKQEGADWLKQLESKKGNVFDSQTEQVFQKAAVILNYSYPNDELTKTTAYQSVSDIKRLFSDPDESELTHLDDWNRLQTPTRGHRIVQSEFRLPQFMEQKEYVTSAQVGTATHELLRQVSLKQEPTIAELTNQLKKLETQKVIERAVAQKVNIQHVRRFFKSSLGQLLLKNSENVKREVPFSALIPAKKLFSTIETNNDILLHGIIDGYVDTKTQVVVFDYKTDFLLPEDIEKKKELTARYQGQLNLYALALESILGKKIDHKYLYLLATGQVVEV
ncbi:helicase-exonuclease AddAB subunit AddA [Liquorilactobacillus oeni]|uniref:ATP-dependent helicase/nuclease subunit A n=1 Tax=Liquorilactobacillus oeni DSM 19972 TaxID=1423777 RepID=A0A0R1MC71_9LACO|nr:helicase-exonuclease AddAB subunit AddA [Liquorilactobacillus oeni]KRL05676.1 ATP-dependent nuclease subunit A [Liquorilactobacillus oeni DSM 19972]